MTKGELAMQLCKENRIPVSRLEKECDFSNGYIRSLAKNGRTINDEKFDRMLCFFEKNGVDTSRFYTEVDGFKTEFREPEALLEQKRIFMNNMRNLMNIRGMNPTDVARATGIPSATMSNWMTGSAYPRVEKLDALAEYFGCTRKELMEDKTRSEQKEYYIDSEASKIAEIIRKDERFATLFDASQKVKPEDLEKVIGIIKLMAGDI